MRDDPPMDPSGRLGRDYFELALELLPHPASIDASVLPLLPDLIASAPGAADAATRRQLALSELRARLARLSTGERVALIVAAERRSPS